MTSTLRVDTAGPIGTITLDRADQLNAMNADMLGELAAAATTFNDHPEVRVVIVRGAGRAFSAGADLSLIAGMDQGADPRAQADLGRKMADAVEAMDAVTIAAIHGWCVGGALVLAAACDLRVAEAGARFSIPEIDLGIPLAWGGIPRLVREIGPALTKELVLTARPFDAAEAASAGFLNRVAADGRLEEEVTELARRVASKAPLPILATKRHTNAVTAQMVGVDRSWSDADGLLAALTDPACVAARERYLASKGR
ncbi:enoyl-CoA hydratase/isomerase family protein [Euzebya tangerina]|uniref:enoyl-CoA hydratase/isomerase family protein n=1 Tax=Euzebya tangerina TaxID=591198 RepID=UPI000E320CB6|nr:enoyl-CoA hydratase/isomerase family protein [Euzebya tangerina]